MVLMPYLSGTEWEYEDALSSTREPRPEVLVYRRTNPPKIDLNDPGLAEKRDQYALVEQFFRRFQSPDGSLLGGHAKYAAPSEFAEKLKGSLRSLLQQRLEAAQTLSVPKDEIQRSHASPSLSGAAIIYGRRGRNFLWSRGRGRRAD